VGDVFRCLTKTTATAAMGSLGGVRVREGEHLPNWFERAGLDADGRTA